MRIHDDTCRLNMTTTTQTQILPPSGPIENLKEKDRVLLSQVGSFQFAPKGERIIQQGENHGRLIFVLSGTLQSTRERHGKTEVLWNINAGEWLGAVHIFNPGGAISSVHALEPTEYWVITREALETFLNSNHKAGNVLLIGLAMTLSKRIREATQIHPSPSKSMREKMLSYALAAFMLTTLVAAWNWISADQRLKKLDSFYREQATENDKTVEQSRLKIKNLEEQISQTYEDDEFIQNEAKKKSPHADGVQNTPSPALTESQPPAEPKTTESEASKNQLAPKEEAPLSRPQLPVDTSKYPSEIKLTTETTVPLIVNGKLSGSAKIPVGRIFKVIGVEDHDVLVFLADSTVRIPKDNTDFAKAMNASTHPATPTKEDTVRAAQSVAAPVAPEPRAEPSLPVDRSTQP
ncbi:MAG: cyclic nucleotide-binding domain-containing protein [bacterium]